MWTSDWDQCLELMARPIVIFDIDGTLADIRHRVHHVRGDKKRRHWGRFFKEMVYDVPNKPILDLWLSLKKADTYNMYIFTGRPEDYREATESWLIKNHIYPDKLFMRPKGDHRQDCLVKTEMLDKIDESMVTFIVDDRKQVVAMWREKGLCCLQVADGDF